jgi:sulfite reductase (ferredoxin)
MTTTFYRLPADLAADIDAYERDVGRFLAGEMPAAVLKAKRVPRGVYEQRQDGTFMVRVRVAGGTLNPAQTGALAGLSREFGNGLLHVTTRQDVQFHDVSIGNTPVVMRRLLDAGLTSKGGGGNTVRNVTACPYAGICRSERFDVTPCAHAVTEYLIPLVGSYNLPRKYKIAFSGCGADCALAQVADLGFIAEVRDGQAGFRVMAGGGMGAQSRLADTLLDWTPATEIVRVAETVRRLFDELGDRSNKHRARLRFVFDRLGIEAVRRRFGERLAEAVRDGVPAWPHSLVLNRDLPAGEGVAPRAETRAGIRVIAQRQAGHVAVPLHAPLGFLPAGDLARIGELAERFSGEAGVRTTLRQDLLVRFVKETDLSALAAGLRTLETDVLSPVPLDRFVACAGASTCRLGICLARNAARACADALAAAGVARDTLDDMDFHINGCSNACGQQPVGPIGFFGVAQRAHDHLAPSYAVTLGGRCGARGARFGSLVGKVPAAALPAFAADLGKDFETRRAPGESFPDYVDRLGLAYFQALAVRYAAIPGFSDRPEFYRDVGAEADFSLAGRGAGECGAGVFEVIQQDLAAARKAVTPFNILLPAARALLITRGVDSRDTDTVLREFERHFIDTGLVADEFRALLARARGHEQGWQTALDGREAAVLRLRDRVELLYSTLDANLVFHPPGSPAPKTEGPAAAPAVAGGAPEVAEDRATAELDLSGVPCPMNFVKAKMKLEPLNLGDTLAVVLDDGEPVRNVPVSFKNEGQEVAGMTQRGDGRWRVVVRKRR